MTRGREKNTSHLALLRRPWTIYALIGVVVCAWLLWAFLAFGSVSGSTSEMNAEAQMGELRSAVTAYFLAGEADGLPASLAQVRDGDEEVEGDDLLDPWGNAYVYRVLGPCDFELFSAGPDGREHTADDVEPSTGRGASIQGMSCW